ncbi:hypothetical protein ACHAXN_003085 [Cyclotella atomus]
MMRRLHQSSLIGSSYKRFHSSNTISNNNQARPLTTSHCFGINANRFTWSTTCNGSLPLRNPRRHCFSTQQQHQQQQQEEKEDPQSTLLLALQSLPNLSSRILSKIHTLKSRHDEISTQLQQGGGDQTISLIGKELSSLSPISSLVDRVLSIHDETESLKELQSESMLSEHKDEELLSEIHAELSRLELELETLSNKLLQSLVPMFHPDEEGDLTTADAVIDIRAGTGGDEAALFAAEILAGYEAIAKRGGAEDGSSGDGKAWDVEILSCSKTDLGGVKEASLSISSRSGAGGNNNNYNSGYSDTLDFDNTDPEAQAQQLLQQLGPFGFFQYESGVHRVQRVPVNDNKLQTSAVSVAVLPSIPDSQSSDTLLPPQELKIETMRASGAGGQHVNTTESAVRITHIPTGIMAYMQEERSQHKNKSKALKLVAARVYQLRKEQALKDRSATRSSLMGGGDRSERIRTYNFPQDRITDHRCKVSVSGVPTWLGGGGMVRKFGPYLYQMEREERVVALEEEEEATDGKKGGKKR